MRANLGVLVGLGLLVALMIQGQGSAGSSQPTVSISDATVTEGHSGTVNATFTISLSEFPSSNVTVSYATANGSAVAPDDYRATSGQATITVGCECTTTTITVAVLGDTLDENNETFLVNLSNPVNATISDSQGVGTIVDDDNPPSLSISDTSVNENAGTASFTVSLSAASGKSISVSAQTANGTATAGSDYTSTSASITFNPGETSKTFSVPITNDTVDEPNETFVVNLSSPSNATIADNQAVGTIVDDDGAPTLAINDVTVTEGNSGTTNAVFTVTVNGAHQGAITVSYATANGSAVAPGDYTSTSGSLTIPGGVNSGTISVPVVGDTTVEPDEQFTVNLSNCCGATISDAQGVGTIKNDDSATTPPSPPSPQPPPPPASFTLNVAVSGSGQVTGPGIACPGDCSQSYTAGTSVTLRATAATDWRLRTWGDACAAAGSAGTCTLAMTVNRTASASFEAAGGIASVTVVDRTTPEPPPQPPPPRETLAVNVTGNGNVSSQQIRVLSATRGAALVQQIKCGVAGADRILSACYATVRPDQQVQLSATPSSGYRFEGWSGACRGKSRQCSVNVGDARTVSANFERVEGAVAVAATLRPPRFRITWARTVGDGTLLVRGSVSAPARVRLQLRRPGGGPLATKRLSVTGGSFQTTMTLRSGRLAGGALVLPGGFVVSMTGAASGIRLPLQVRTITLSSPQYGVVREAFVSASRGGPKVLSLPAGARQAWANFRFATQPRLGQEIVVEWLAPNGTSIGTQTKSNRPVIQTGIGAPVAIPNGRWVAILRANGRVIKQLSVQIGPG